jgi:hypothetical protein
MNTEFVFFVGSDQLSFESQGFEPQLNFVGKLLGQISRP